MNMDVFPVEPGELPGEVVAYPEHGDIVRKL